MVKVGVIGIGYWGKKALIEYLSLKREGLIEQVHVFDVSQLAKERIGSDGVIIDDSVDDILDRTDAVHVCTPNETHYDVASKAITHGAHVLIEKPMTNSSKTSYKLVEASMASGTILQVGHVFRFANVIRKAKELIDEGYLGEIYAINIEWAHLWHLVEGEDVCWDLLPHALDILNFLTNEWPVAVNGLGTGFRRTQPAEVASINYEMPGNIIANIRINWLSHRKTRKIEIIGSLRAAEIDALNQTLLINEKFETTPVEIERNNTIKDEIVNFLNAMEKGKNMYNSAIIGAKTVETIERTLEVTKHAAQPKVQHH